MMRALSLSLCLLLPVAAFADEGAAAPVAGADTPTQASLVPNQSAPAPAVEEARQCGMHHCGGGKGKWIVLTGVVGTVLTAVAVGVAVSAASRSNSTLTR